MKQISDIIADPSQDPIIRAQVNYMEALMDKYITSQVIYRALDCSRFMPRLWRTGERVLSPHNAFLIEHLLDERKIRYADFLKKEWKTEFD